MVWTVQNGKILDTFPTNCGLPEEVVNDPASTIKTGCGKFYVYRVCREDQLSTAPLKAKHGDFHKKFAVLYGAGAYPHLVDTKGDSVTPMIVDAVNKGSSYNEVFKSPFIHCSTDADKIWSKYGQAEGSYTSRQWLGTL